MKNIIQENSWVITTKKGKGKLPSFSSNVEQVISIYAGGDRRKRVSLKKWWISKTNRG